MVATLDLFWILRLKYSKLALICSSQDISSWTGLDLKQKIYFNLSYKRGDLCRSHVKFKDGECKMHCQIYGCLKQNLLSKSDSCSLQHVAFVTYCRHLLRKHWMLFGSSSKRPELDYSLVFRFCPKSRLVFFIFQVYLKVFYLLYYKVKSGVFLSW